MDGRVPNVLATETPSGVPTHRGNMITCKAVEAEVDGVPGDRPGGRRRVTMGLGPSAADFVPAVLHRSPSDLSDRCLSGQGRLRIRFP